ncbi:MAG: amidohydrolase family protein [Candidatus Kerfeldbacteria bacterium]
MGMLFTGRFLTLLDETVDKVLVDDDGLIVATGDLAGLLVKNAEIETVELPGYTMPGFRSEHDHMLFTLVAGSLSLRGVDNEGEAATLIRTALGRRPEGWVVITDWNDSVLNTAQMSDLVNILAADRMLLVLNTSWHSAFGSRNLIKHVSPTLRAMNLATGSCIGQLLTEDHVLQTVSLMQTNADALVSSVMDRQQFLFSKGVTSMFDKLVHGEAIHDAMERASRAGWLKYHIFAAVQPWMMRNGLMPGPRGRSFEVKWMKYLADGSFGSRTAFMARDYGMMYSDGTEGVFQLPPPSEIYDDLTEWLDKGGEGLCVHAIGPGAVHNVIGLFEWLYKRIGDKSVMMSLEHGTTWVPGLVERFAKLQHAGYNIRLCSQMSFTEDASQYADRLPQIVCDAINPYADFERCGVLYSGGTDGPICNDDHLGGTSQAVNRPGSQAIDAQTALRRVTEGPMEAGMPFNMVCLNRDIIEKPMEMALAQPLQTWINGKKVWEKSDNE